jgi:SAM-dependent methyltransferase
MRQEHRFVYVGSELDVFAHATNWKKYFSSAIRPYVRRTVLEVGAGIGATTEAVHNEAVSRWVCLEPDAALAERIDAAAMNPCEVRIGTLDAVGDHESFDTILYMDVLEHIVDDQSEVTKASGHLNPNGHLIVLAPAHQALFTSFDRAIGHHRRYSKSMLRSLKPIELVEIRMMYLDSVGFLASLGNRLLLRSARPTLTQILLWDRVLVRTSTLMDRLFQYSMGKSILGVWQRRA